MERKKQNNLRRRGSVRHCINRLTAVMLVLILSMSACLMEAGAVSWNASADADDNFQQLRFWEDEKPSLRFYINAAARYELETVKAPILDTNAGEWTVMSLLRGMYTGMDYLNYIPDDYFEGYYQRMVETVQSKNGVLDAYKITEWCRVILALSALGKSPADVGGYDFLDKLSKSYHDTYWQGINGPIFSLIALNTGGYQLYETPSEYQEGDINTEGRMLDYIVRHEILNSDKTIGGWALNDANAAENGADADITGMALQAMAPYYLDELKYKESGAATPYSEFIKAVERGIYTLHQMQLDNGGFKGWGSDINTESTTQVIVALTELGIDPLSESVVLSNIGKECGFVTKGAVWDGTRCNNMIDAILMHWEKNSGSSEAVGGFKHVTAGDDGGGGSGNSVNPMATDQALYALISYDRFLNGENKLYDMTDMTDGSYTQMTAETYNITYDGNGSAATGTEPYAPYEEVLLPVVQSTGDEAFVAWNTKADGTGTTYRPGETLSMPEQDVTLYAMFGQIDFSLELELNGGVLSEGVTVPDMFTPMDAEIVLPTADEITKEGCIFNGWYLSASAADKLSGTTVTSVPKGTYGDQKYYAGWRVSFDKINPFGVLISSLGKEIRISDRSVIRQARAIYDSMSVTEQKNLTCRAYYEKLVSAEEALKQLEASMDQAEVVISLITDIGMPVTLDREPYIREARESYDALQEEDKAYVTNYADLIAAEESLVILQENQEAADAAAALIRGIGEVTLESETVIAEARAAFELLTGEQQQLIKESTIALLESAELTLEQLREQAERIQNVRDLIALIPETLSIEDDSFQIVSDAQAAYIALSGEERQEITAEEADVIRHAQEVLNELAQQNAQWEDIEVSKELVTKISNYGGTAELEDEEDIQAIRAEYDGFTNVQKALVENYYSLVALEEILASLHLDVEAAAEIEAMIAAIGEVTLEKEEEIVAVGVAYRSLTANQKQLVENYSDLVAAQQALSVLRNNRQQAQKTIDKIEAIGNVTLDSLDAILKAEKSYDKLTDAQKSLISEELLKVLADARTEYDRLEGLVLKGIELSESEITLTIGSTEEITVGYEPENTLTSKEILWSSSDPEVITVEDGVITAVGAGDAAVIARAKANKRIMATCAVHVKVPLTGITVNRKSMALTRGEVALLQVGFLPEDTTDDKTVTWTSGDPKVAQVSAAGKVTGIANGTTTITASVGKFKVSCSVQVYNYKISYQLNGGTNNSSNPVRYSGPWNVTLKNATRAGYTFGGWYTDKNFKNRITMIEKGSNKDYTLYAKWIKVTAPGKMEISSLTNTAAGSMKVTVKGKPSGAAGYHVLYADNSGMKNAKNIYTTMWGGKTIASLTPGKTYYVKVRAYKKDSAGKTIFGAYTAVRSVALAIPEKTVLSKVQSWGSQTLKISWEKVSGASGYQIYQRSSKTGPWKQVTQIANGNTTSYLHGNLTSGRTYDYVVRAYRTVKNKKYIGANSNTVSGKPVPAQVKNVTVRQASSNSIKVGWGKVNGASGYQIYRRNPATGKYQLVVQLNQAGATSYTEKGLKKGVTYTYVVRAYRTGNGSKVLGANSAETKGSIK